MAERIAGGSLEADLGARLRLRMRMHSKQHGLASQHERLEEFCRELCTKIPRDGARAAVEDFSRFAAALDAHMKVEEEVYFPALHGLAPDSERELTILVEGHVRLRRQVVGIEIALRRGDTSEAGNAVERLAIDVTDHEHAEERLIARITLPDSSA